MANHCMKVHPEPFEALLSGAKNSEVRALDGRNFQVGDTVSLAEVGDEAPHKPTGRTMDRVITHVQTGYGLPAYMCVLSYENPRLEDFKAAYMEWQDKTEWVQKTVTAKELGRHRADVMTDRIAELERENSRIKAEVAYGSAGYQAALEEIERLKNQLNTERGLHMAECNKAVRLHNELEACREIAEHNAQAFGEKLKQVEAYQKDAERLRTLLVEASETIEEWGAYADDYFKEKHGLARDVAYYRDAAMKEGAANAAP